MLFAKLAAALLLMSLTTTAAEVPLPELHIEPTGGGSILNVRNVGFQPLTAFLIELVNYPGSYYSFWQDDVTSEPIPAGGEQHIRIANMTVGAVPDYVKMQAALYADGTSSGIPEKVAQLTERRRFSIGIARELIQRLENAQAAGTAKDAIIADLRQWAESMQPAGKPKRNSQSGINQAAGRTLITDAVASLDAHSVEETLATLRAGEHRAAASMSPSK